MLRIGRRQGFMVAWVGTADPSPQKKSPRGSPVKNAFNSAILVYSEFEMKPFCIWGITRWALFIYLHVWSLAKQIYVVKYKRRYWT